MLRLPSMSSRVSHPPFGGGDGRAGRPSRQVGQALVLGLVLMFAGLLVLLLAFSTAQVSETRHRLDNAADAAAWSAGLWQARVLNYQALANRAIVAEEVAIAQAVTLASWASYFDHVTESSAALAAVWPPAAALLGVAASLVQGNALMAQSAAALEVPARSVYKELLAASQEILQFTVGTFALGAVANEVARATDSRFFAFALPPSPDAAIHTRVWSGDDRSRLNAVVQESLDAFVRGPRGLDETLWLIPGFCFGRPFVSVNKWFQSLHKRGGTVMAPAYERWEAADTLSIHNWWPSHGFFGFFKGCNDGEMLPLGWGAAIAAGSSDPFGPWLIANPGDIRNNPTAASLAQETLLTEPLQSLQQAYPGLASVRELDYDALKDPRNPVGRVSVLARIDAEKVRTANTLNLGVGRLRVGENFAGSRVWSLSSAEVIFRRPPGDGSPDVEYASLYSPYWQVRLSTPTLEERALAQTYVR